MTEVPPPADSTPARAAPRGALFIVFLVVFIDLLGFGIVLPLLPRISEVYIEQVFAADAEVAHGLIIGLLMASFSFMQFLVAPVWGSFSDQRGRRPILLLGLTGSVIFYGLFGFACSLPADEYAGLALTLFFVARIGAGIAGATISTAQAVIADCTPPEKRKHGMALIGAAFGIGFTFGPVLGAGALYFFPQRFELIGYTAAALSLVALLLGIYLLPETLVNARDERRRLSWSGLQFVVRNAALGPVVLTFFLASLGFGGFESTLALLLKDSFGLLESNSFLIFAYVGFMLMLAQGVFYRRLASRVSELTFMTAGVVLMAVGVAVLGAVSQVANSSEETQAYLEQARLAERARLSDASTHWDVQVRLGPAEPQRLRNVGLMPYLFAGLTAAVFGFAFLTPSAQALVSRRTPPDRQGEILGVNQSASAMARILGPVGGLTLYKATATHLLPYAFGAALLILMLPTLAMIGRGEPK